MHTIMLFLYIFCLAGAIALLFRRKIEETFAPGISFSVVILYILGLITKNLKFGVYICWTFGIIALCYCILCFLKRRELVIQYCITPGLGIYAIFALIIKKINYGRLFSEWDEFSHWGTVVKNMYILNQFGNVPESTTYFKGYPPGTALWQYFSLQFLGVFSEHIVYVATGLMIVSMFIPIIKYFPKKNVFSAFFCTLTFVLTPSIFLANYFVTLYVDIILGIQTGYIIICGLNKNKQWFDYINIGLTICILCLTKASGIGLAIITLLIISMSKLINLNYMKDWKKAIHICLKGKKSWMISGIYITSIIIGKISWIVYLNLTQTESAWNTEDLNIANLIQLFQGRSEEYRYQVIKNFINALSDITFTIVPVKLNYMTIASIILLAFLFLYKKASKYQININDNRNQFYLDAIQINILIIGLYIGLIIYTISLLILYIFTYSIYEATILASYARYLNTYFVAMLYVLFYLAINQLCLIKNVNSTKIFINYTSFICIISLIIIMLPISNIQKSCEYEITIEQRKNFKHVEVYRNYLENNIGKLYIIDQHSKGTSYWQIRYLLGPMIKTSPNFSWSIGKKYDDKDIWTLEINCNQWLSTLSNDNYKYVYIHNADEQFKNSFNNAFENSEDIINGYLYIFNKNTKKLIRINP